MLSKNNRQEQFRKQEPKKQRFAIKKLTVGVASVLIGFTFMGLNTQASADDTPTQPANSNDDTQSNASTALQSTASVTLNNSASQVNSESAKPTNVAPATPVADSYQSAVAANVAANIKSAAQTSASAANESNASATSSAADTNAAANTKSAIKTPVSASGESDSSLTSSDAITTNINELLTNLSTDLSGTAENNAPVTGSAAKDDNVITSNGNGVITGKNSKGTWAAMDATTPAAPVAYKNTMNVDDWQSFANALNDASVDNINITKDITVTGAVNGITGSSAFHFPRYKGLMELDGTNVARKLTITGNGHTVDFGKYYLEFQDQNQKDGGSWDITVDNTKIKAGDVASVEAGQYPPFYFGEVGADNQKKDTITFKDINANISDRGLVRGAKGHNHGSEYITVVLKGTNTIYDKANQDGAADSGSTISGGYVRVEDGTTSIEMTDAGSGANNYGGDAIRTAQTDIHNNDGSTVYTFDIKKGATLNIKGGKDVRGIYAVDGVHGTANIDGTVKMDLGTGHSMAVFAGQLNVGKDGVLDVTAATDATPDFGQIARSISNFNGGQYGVINIGVGQPINTTNVDSTTINDDGIIRVKRTSTNSGMNPIISMGSGSSAVLKGTFTINVNQGATLDLQDSRQQTNLGMIFVSGSSANSNINIVNPKYVNLQRLNTPLPSNGSDLIYLEGGGQSGRTNGVHISNAPIAEWQAANTSTAPNFTWMVQSVNSMNNWGTNAGSGFTV
ncbi:MAG: YSIRK-type signal peptide-containing protein, partial [Lactobacillus sp.]|nr:YSIRK-type signal peptide-containing protein [Lactobacillus sp.]